MPANQSNILFTEHLNTPSALSMDRDTTSILCHNPPVVLIHILSISYFGLLAANFLCGFLSLPLHHAQGVLPIDLVVLSFLLTVVSFSFLCLRSRIARKTSDLELASAIAFIAISTISFVFFQFYHEPWSCGLYMVMLSLSALQAVSQFWKDKSNFPEVCLGFGMLCSIPAIHASIWPSACRLPMALHFITFLSINAIGGLNFFLRVPERLAGIRSHPISCFIMHASVIMTAIVLSQKLLSAKTSDNTFLLDGCRGLSW